MPNIEMHGFNDEEHGKVIGEITDVVKAELPNKIDDVVVTICNDIVLPLGEGKARYIRIIDTKPEKVRRVAVALSELGFDVELVAAHDFLEGRPPVA